MIIVRQKQYSLDPEVKFGIKSGLINVAKWVLPGSITIAFLPLDYAIGGGKKVADSLIMSAITGLLLSPFAFKYGYNEGVKAYKKKEEEEFKNDIIKKYPEIYGLCELASDKDLKRAYKNIKGRKDQIPGFNIVINSNKSDLSFTPIIATKKSDPLIGINMEKGFWCLSNNISNKINLKKYLLEYYNTQLSIFSKSDFQEVVNFLIILINKLQDCL